jgi:hypothetical protein
MHPEFDFEDEFPAAPKKKNDFYDIIGKIIDMSVKIVGVVPYLLHELWTISLTTKRVESKYLLLFS